METKEILFKPKDLYTKQLQRQYHEGAEKYFDDLAKECKVDIDANREHVKKYNQLLEEQKNKENKVNSTKAKKIVSIVFIIIGFILGAIFLLLGFTFISRMWWGILVSALLVGLSIFLIIYNQKKLKKDQQAQEEALEKIKQDIANMLEQCNQDMAILNASFDWNTPAAIMESVTNIIDLDPFFSIQRFTYLQEKFGFKDVNDSNVSVLGVLSGNIQGNPFVLEKLLTEKLEPKTYTGNLTIHWTTYTRDSKGHSVAHHHSETLTAYASHPAASYRTQTVLVYGNEAAPHLHFRHTPSDINNLTTEKARENAVKAGMKEINKYADKCLMEGKDFNTTGNDEFDVFFGGLDRDHEVEFRLLFSPLAVNNMMALISDPQPYGDDFYMIKDGMINMICSAHSQNFDYSGNPYIYIGFDFDACKENFVAYCDNFIQGLFFDLAPLLSLPLYQIHKPVEYIYEKELPCNYSTFEQEAMANAMDKRAFSPNGADMSLPLLLKTKRVTEAGKTDKVVIHAYSYHTTPMVDYVSVLGGDGRHHDVPVHWTKYDRVDCDSLMELKHVGSTRKDYINLAQKGKLKSIISDDDFIHYERGLLAFKIAKDFDESSDKELDNLFADEKK